MAPRTKRPDGARMAMRAFLTARAPRRGTRVAARYSVRLDCLGREELEDEKAKLTLQPRGSFGTPPAGHTSPPSAPPSSRARFRRTRCLYSLGAPSAEPSVSSERRRVKVSASIGSRCVSSVFINSGSPRETWRWLLTTLVCVFTSM